jgi:hypothetical protein
MSPLAITTLWMSPPQCPFLSFGSTFLKDVNNVVVVAAVAYQQSSSFIMWPAIVKSFQSRIKVLTLF